MARCQSRTPDRERVLRPLRRLCPACGGAMRIRYENRRTLVTLSSTVRMHLKIRRCDTPVCRLKVAIASRRLQACASELGGYVFSRYVQPP